MDQITTLKKSLLFSGLNDADLAQLAAITNHRSIGKGETLFSEGETADNFFLMVSGSIKMCRISAEGREKVLHFVRPGETFAEAAFFGDGKYPAEARSLETGEVVCIPKNGFMELMRTNPQFSLNLVISLSLMLRKFARQIEELTFADVASRLASFLVKQADDHSTSYGGIVYFDLGVKKGELAARLGTASETISRTLRKLREEGIIEVNGKRVTVLKMDQLRKLAERQPQS